MYAHMKGRLLLLHLLLALWVVSCSRNVKRFRLVSSAHSGIHFNNKIVETDSMNPIDVTNIYNGGGVGVGDFNNDGLTDVYFTGNMVANRLYLNKGEMEFEDVTEKSGVDGQGKWCRGVAVVDINNDGWMDIYVCASMSNKSEKRKNILYINYGVNKNGMPLFKDLAAEYGLDDNTHTTMAAFFDYDNDTDLDVYLAVNEILPGVNPSVFKPKVKDGSFPSTGRLYRNDFDSVLQHPVFTNVSVEAGVTIEGYAHGVSVADINKDGWKDIYVTNDFIANDLLYINNHDGTFTDKASTYFKHTSANGMGQDVIDINNDGLSDVIELDMNPEDNYRKKMMQNPANYQTYQLNNFFKYQYQYVRNTLQANLGPRVNGNDSVGDPVFADLGFFSGISETDWSWTPLVADFDNDGLRDVAVTNGFPKDVTDHDFITYRKEASPTTAQSNVVSQIPEVKLHNYIFQNNGGYKFMNVSADWGFTAPSFSNGAAYADLDNDGDLDAVVNNINDEAFLYENTSASEKKSNEHFLSVQLVGEAPNRNGLGAWVELYYAKQHQAYEQTPYRGYLSTIQLNPHFGLGPVSEVDSVIVKWPDGTKQSILNVRADQTLKIEKKNAKERYDWITPPFATAALFTDITQAVGINYKHTQTDYIDFRIQKLLPHKLSEYGSSLSAGDLNGDSLDDLVIGGNSSSGTAILMQQRAGTFQQQSIGQSVSSADYQDMGISLFDADADNDLDLYIAKGGYETAPNSPIYQDRFYVNDGKGNFRVDSSALPVNYASKSCVRAVDYDKDGDLDMFVAGRVEPWHYPKKVSSFIYRNDSKNGNVKFTDVTMSVAKELQNIGLVCDAVFTDFDNDGWFDLMLAGEWMPLTFLKNENGVFRNITGYTGISSEIGWWNSIAPADFDNDGDIDYVVGNLGLNSFYKASSQYPVSIVAKDFDNNGSYDAFPAIYLPSSQNDTSKKEFPVPLRDDAIKQMIGMRSKFQNYKTYANATIDQLFTPEQMKNALMLRANNLSSTYCRNDGAGKFTLLPLPSLAQASVINGMVADDLDADGNIDLVINTNDYGTDLLVGRYDALNGLILKGDGKGNFLPLSIMQSGIYLPGNGKALVKLRSSKGKYLIAATENRGPLKILSLKKDLYSVAVGFNEVRAEVTFKNGKRQLHEFSYGASFLSQSGRFISVPSQATSVSLSDYKGQTRKIIF
jgi:hypothetical protein